MSKGGGGGSMQGGYGHQQGRYGQENQISNHNGYNNGYGQQQSGYGQRPQFPSRGNAKGGLGGLMDSQGGFGGRYNQSGYGQQQGGYGGGYNQQQGGYGQQGGFGGKGGQAPPPMSGLGNSRYGASQPINPYQPSSGRPSYGDMGRSAKGGMGGMDQGPSGGGGGIRTADFRDSDGNGQDDRDQNGGGMISDMRYRGGSNDINPITVGGKGGNQKTANGVDPDSLYSDPYMGSNDRNMMAIDPRASELQPVIQPQRTGFSQNTLGNRNMRQQFNQPPEQMMRGIGSMYSGRRR